MKNEPRLFNLFTKNDRNGKQGTKTNKIKQKI